MVDLKDVILYVISKYVSKTGHGIGRVRLMKTLFLIDYVYKDRYGRKLTSLNWRMWLFGPFTREVLDILDELELKGKVSAEIDDVGIFYSTYEGVKLDDDVRRVIDEVIEEYSTKPLEELLQVVYNLKEVKEAKLGDSIL